MLQSLEDPPLAETRDLVGVEGIEPSISASRTQRDADSLHSVLQ